MRAASQEQGSHSKQCRLVHCARRVACAGMLWVTAPANAAESVALVIDNKSPVSASNTTPASQLVAILRSQRYKVIFGRALATVDLKRDLELFKAELPEADAALFYYAGPMLSIDGRNRLVLRDASPGRPIDQGTMPLDAIADILTAKRTNVVLLESAYADPVATAMAQSDGKRSLALADVSERDRLLVVMAQLPGKVMRFDTDSAFSRALVRQLASARVDDWHGFAAKLRHDVFLQTRGSQIISLTPTSMQRPGRP